MPRSTPPALQPVRATPQGQSHPSSIDNIRDHVSPRTKSFHFHPTTTPPTFRFYHHHWHHCQFLQHSGTMALFLTDRQHYYLQQFFLGWAPGVPPAGIRRKLFGLPGTESAPSRDDRSLITSAAGAFSNSEFVNSEEDVTIPSHSDDAVAVSLLHSKSSTTTTTLGTLYSGYPLTFGSASDNSIRECASGDKMQAATQVRTPADNKELGAQGEDDFQEQRNHKNTGIFQAKAPWSGPGPAVNSVDDASRCIQEIKHSEGVESTINAVASWAATASPNELQDFNKSCEVYPYAMWVRPILPQLDYSELLTILPYIQQDYKQDGRKSIPYINLEAAHLLGMMWSKLFARGILTLKTYSDGLLELVRSDTYAHWDILDTILTTRLDELSFIPGEEDLAQYLVTYRDHVRGNKLRELERMDGMDSEEWH